MILPRCLQVKGFLEDCIILHNDFVATFFLHAHFESVNTAEAFVKV